MVVVKQVPVSVGRVPTGGCVIASLKVATMVVANSIEVVRVKTLAFLATFRRGDLMIQTRGPIVMPGSPMPGADCCGPHFENTIGVDGINDPTSIGMISCTTLSKMIICG